MTLPDPPSAHKATTTPDPFDEVPCGLVRTDGRGTFLRVNRLFCEWVGREPAELVGLRRLQDLFTMGGRIFHQTHWMPLLQMQGSISEVKIDLLCAQGPDIPVVMNAVRREREGGFVHEIALFVARDRDRYERELIGAQKRLQLLVDTEKKLSEEALDRAAYAEQLVGIVSHDLRNPLSAIQLGVVALARSKPNEQQQRILDRISRSANRTNRLIADLLDFTQARLGSGLVAHRLPMDLHAMVAEAIDELGTVFPQRQFRHVTSGAGEVLGDLDRLTQLIGNLVANAAAYGEPGTPIMLSSEVEAGHFAISVHNIGRPIPAELLPRLFQPLVRGEEHAGEASSVGLGLYIVDAIVKSHGGSMAVSSSAEFGTAFTARFPRAAAGDPAR
ncbi:PAS domain-containing sensor histidine kinase [Xylophilus sp. GOD-11R]|uniref:PAS domain-containing sensor histidine kinase n=1 Tax=Xylophilus sp. GOD-11R TaxID=3089814 RepID=UPI00298D2D21|nr:PAS domain-containing sensor histidine kinase [Xylophilus sp. GOD-11R]WPB55417.1 PAS domain-containing sensor histidine kinase [Xylophilus sp. GOD-11R]